MARGASGSHRLADLVIATDDERIAAAVRSRGRRAVMTSGDHRCGTDRIAEVVRNEECDLVINIQGDEPLVRGEMIDALVDALAAEPDLGMATLAHPITAGEAADPDAVKVVVSAAGRALYFSRSPIPYRRIPETGAGPGYLRHIGIYGYRREFLLRFTALAPTPLEEAEALEQLRALENGCAIGVVETEHRVIGVDTPADLERVREILAGAAAGPDGEARRERSRRA